VQSLMRSLKHVGVCTGLPCGTRSKVWDAGGKLVKQHAKNEELKGERYANSRDIYIKLRHALRGPVASALIGSSMTGYTKEATLL
jgi:hypothetical protein